MKGNLVIKHQDAGIRWPLLQPLPNDFGSVHAAEGCISNRDANTGGEFYGGTQLLQPRKQARAPFCIFEGSICISKLMTEAAVTSMSSKDKVI